MKWTDVKPENWSIGNRTWRQAVYNTNGICVCVVHAKDEQSGVKMAAKLVELVNTYDGDEFS